MVEGSLNGRRESMVEGSLNGRRESMVEGSQWQKGVNVRWEFQCDHLQAGNGLNN